MLSDASAGLSSLRDGASKPLFALLAMVAVLLVIACGNVAGLLLARAAGRSREIAIRLSIGAGRARLVRQLLAESLLLALTGGVLGITFAVWARDGLLALMVNVGSSGTPIDLNTGIDWRVLGFALGISAVTGLACGILPAVRGSGIAVAESLKQASRGSVGADGGRRGLLVGKALVAAQMAFCLLLLVVAGLFARSLQSLTRTDVGFDRDRVLTARVDVRGAGYTPDERLAMYRRVIAKLETLPGVQSVSFSAKGRWPTRRGSAASRSKVTLPRRDERVRTNEEIVTDRYFETVGLKLLEGRLFGPEDRAPGGRNTIINATMAKRFFPGQSAVGKRWTTGGPFDRDAYVIVGVVEDARYVDLRVAPPNMVYRLAESAPGRRAVGHRSEGRGIARSARADGARDARPVRAAAANRRSGAARGSDRPGGVAGPHDRAADVDVRGVGIAAREPRDCMEPFHTESAAGWPSWVSAWRSARIAGRCSGWSCGRPCPWSRWGH